MGREGGIILMAISAECPNGFLGGGGAATRFHFPIQVLTINIHRDFEAARGEKENAVQPRGFSHTHTQSGVNAEVSWLQLQLQLSLHCQQLAVIY